MTNFKAQMTNQSASWRTKFKCQKPYSSFVIWVLSLIWLALSFSEKRKLCLFGFCHLDFTITGCSSVGSPEYSGWDRDEMFFYTYILKSEKTGGFYIGFTRNLDRRVEYHNRNLNRSTRGRGPWFLVCHESFSSTKEALKREKFLKKQKNRNFYERLISGCSSAS